MRKSSGSETTFREDLTADTEIEAGVLRMADDVWSWCEKRQAFGRTATIKVKYADFQQITRSRSRPTVIATHAELRDASLELLRSTLPTTKPIRLVGVTVSNFDGSTANSRLELFQPVMETDRAAPAQ